MSLTIQKIKRPNPDQKTVNSIKIRKLENESYRIENVMDRSEDESYNAIDNYQSSVNSDTFQEGYNNSYEGELVCTPSFDAFDSIIRSQEEDEMEDNGEEPFMNLPLEIKIESVTSLNPTASYEDNEMVRDRDVYMDSVYSPDEMPRGGTSPSSVKQMLRERKIRPLRHLAYIFADDGNRYFPCHCCNSAFIKKYLLIKHYAAKHKEVVACKLCACIFTSRMQDAYHKHMRAHNARSPIQTKQCPLCLFWLSPRFFQGHLSVHNLLQKHFCRQCRREFPSFIARAKHICPIQN